MKTNLSFLVLFAATACSFGQVRFEKGYFIDNVYIRTECLIKNPDWKNNPDVFLYKHEETGIPEKGEIRSIREFGIYGSSVFVRAHVRIDRSGNNINELTVDKYPDWSEETLFLKVLVRGEASLYYYEEGALVRFFYSVSDTSIHQLVFKSYLTDDRVAYNNSFRQQLRISVSNDNIKLNALNTLRYTGRDLEKYFITYNGITGEPISGSLKPKRDILNLKVFPGFSISSLSISNDIADPDYLAFTDNYNFRFGMEAEYILPVNRNKWGVFTEPTFQYYSSEKAFGTRPASVDYKSVEFSVGIRYYSYLSNHWKLYMNGIYIPHYSCNFDSRIHADRPVPLNVAPRSSIAVGGGAEYKRLVLEVRYYPHRDILSKYIYWSSDYSRLSFLVGYRIFRLGNRPGITA